jgi:putative ABC transport system substrate-binding protein
MRRREFIAFVGGTVVTWPLATRGQQPKPSTIGYFGATTAAAEKLRTNAFMQRLGELGWIDGQTVAIEYRWAESRTERFPEVAADLVRLRVDTIVATSIAAALACKQATAANPGADRRRRLCRGWGSNANYVTLSDRDLSGL